jgi:putative nucleotidyltransferase with HDIG domain
MGLEPRLSPPIRRLIEEAERAERGGERELAHDRYETALDLLRGVDGSAGTMERFYSAVMRWAWTIESKDAYTRGHCERVARYASALARDVGFDDMTIFWFRIGALLHDVGKIVVPTEILNKPGRLTAEERAVMERHAAAGAELVSSIELPWDILPMVRGHHERWDGRGYPDGLAGEAIPLCARIICVADVFDALTSDRPYRRGYSRENALEIMAADRDCVFDGALFTRFERLIEDPALCPERLPIAAVSSAPVS